MRAVWLLAVLLLAGCASSTEKAYVPPPFDVPAPPPGEVPEVEFIQPPSGLAQITIEGKVLTQRGQPIQGALVWVEGSNLRDPINNVDEYLERRAETMVRTDSQGRYRFVLDEGFYYLTADVPGFYMHRFQPDVRAAKTTFDVYLRPVEVSLVGHRGAYYYAPENTEASLVKAKWLGIDHVEVDVRLSSDGVPVVIHDADLWRVAGDPRRVYDVPWRELSRMDVGRWFGADFAGQKLLDLDGFFDLALQHRVGLVLDVKGMLQGDAIATATYTATLDRIRERGMHDHVIFASFDERAVGMCDQRAGVTCALMTNDESRQRTILLDATRLGADMVMLRRTMVDPEMMQEAAAAGIEVHVWGLNQPEDWQRMHILGVRSWGTDRPGYVLDFLNA